MLKLFFNSDFYFKKGFLCKRKVLMTPEQKIEAVNLVTGKRINSPLHLAVEQKDPVVINYLLTVGAQIDLYNIRGWNPFQATRDTKIQDIEKPIRKLINAGNSMCKTQKEFFEESEEYVSTYQYCIITAEEEVIEDNIVYD